MNQNTKKKLSRLAIVIGAAILFAVLLFTVCVALVGWWA